MAKLKHMFKKTAALFGDRENGDEKPNRDNKKEPSVPEGLWLKCPKCGEMVYREDIKSNSYVCPKCEGYFRITSFNTHEKTKEAIERLKKVL